METDPEITIFDISGHAGMERYAADSVGRVAPLFRSWAALASTEQERAGWLQAAAAHEELARRYRLADQILAEVESALLEEDACPFS